MESNIVPHQEISFDTMDGLSTKMKWKLDQKSTKQAEKQDTQRFIWRLPGRRGTVTLIKNSSLKHNYIVVEAPNPTEVIQAIKTQISCYELDEIISRLASAETADDRINALNLIAAAAPPNYDETVFRSLVRSAEDNRQQVRLAVVSTASQLRWKQLRSIVEQCAESDTSDVLRNISHNILYLTEWNRG